VRTTESGGVCGFDAGKKVKGRKRHIIVPLKDRKPPPDLLLEYRGRLGSDAEDHPETKLADHLAQRRALVDHPR